LGKEPKSELLYWSRELPTEYERGELGLHEQEQVYRLEIRRFIDDSPYSVSTSVLPAKFVPYLEKHLDNFDSLYHILQYNYHFRPVRVRSIIRAIVCAPRDAQFLPNEIPVIQVESLAVHPVERVPIEISIGRTRGDMNEMVVQFGNGGDHTGYEATNKNLK
jgi:GntR family transcriptional regulator